MNASPFARFLNLLKQYKLELRQIYTYAFFIGIVNLSLPLGIQAIINYLQTGEISSSWTVLVGFVLFGIAITGFLQVRQLRVVENIQQDLFARSALEFAFRLPKIKSIQLDKIHAPELVNRFFDTLTIQKGLPKILIDFSLASFQIVFGLILLAIYSPYFIILGVSLIIVLWLIFQITGPKGLKTSLIESKYKYQTAHWLEEIARVNNSFKINPRSDFHLDKTDETTYNYIKSRESHFGVLLNQYRLFVGFKVAVAAGLLLLGSFLVFEGQMNIGQFVAAEIIIILIINSVEKILKVIDTIYDVLTALEKIGYITDLPLDEDSGIATIEKDHAISIQTNDLDFQFPDSQKKVLNELSLNIPANAKAVITGVTGSGKTTLLRLLAGIYKQQGGEILINNIALENYNQNSFYENIGIIFPSNQIFEGTLKENITMGKTISDKKIAEIIHLLGIDTYLRTQTKGIESLVDSGGRRLPRSIMQKIIIARVIINEPKLLLLEDPLQFVSDDEKVQIIDYLTSSERNWTLVVVADYHYWSERATHQFELKK
jgi:ABC-type bacteriocin/lantibiotic exporter with double-glycine peptidase domain